MRGRWRLASLVAVLAAIAAVVWLLQEGFSSGPGEPAASSSRGARVGAPAPDFALRDLDGNTVRLSALRGKKVVLSFWASWCPPCRAEMPALDRVDREYREKGMIVLAVDQMESREAVDAFRRELDLQLSVVTDTLGETARLYRVTSLPATFFIDESGVIRETRVGPLSFADILESLDRAR